MNQCRDLFIDEFKASQTRRLLDQFGIDDRSTRIDRNEIIGNDN